MTSASLAHSPQYPSPDAPVGFARYQRAIVAAHFQLVSALGQCDDDTLANIAGSNSHPFVRSAAERVLRGRFA